MDSSFNTPRSQRSFSGFITSSRVLRDFAELVEGGFEIFDDFLGENVGIGEVVDSSRLSSRSQKMARPTLSRLLSPFVSRVKAALLSSFATRPPGIDI
jgi:hypothetical protein